jgi:hypothetical protein
MWEADNRRRGGKDDCQSKVATNKPSILFRNLNVKKKKRIIHVNA